MGIYYGHIEQTSINAQLKMDDKWLKNNHLLGMSFIANHDDKLNKLSLNIYLLMVHLANQ
jgi:hypothetical protein